MKTTFIKNGSDATVSVVGRFTTDEAAGFLKDIDPVMQEMFGQVTMDLSGLEFISSAGIRCFVMLHKACASTGTKLVLKDLTPQIRDILTLTALIDKFNVE